MSGNEQMNTIRNNIKSSVINQVDLSKDVRDEDILDIIDNEILSACRHNFLGLKDKYNLRREIFNAIRRLDILQELIEDEDITEIMVNGPSQIFIEKEGRILPWESKFETAEKLEDVVQQLVSMSNRIINESNPIVDVRWKDGSRINVVLPPIAINGPIVTIRKFPKNPITMNCLIEMNAISMEASEFLKKLVISGYNIFISGGTGSGKTTFLNALSDFIPQDERVITIEDSAELQIKNIPNLIRLEVRNANVEGDNEITMRDLIKASLRMRP